MSFQFTLQTAFTRLEKDPVFRYQSPKRANTMHYEGSCAIFIRSLDLEQFGYRIQLNAPLSRTIARRNSPERRGQQTGLKWSETDN